MREYEILLEDLNLCNCGNPKETVEWIRDGLRFFAEKCPDYGTFSSRRVLSSSPFFNGGNVRVIKTPYERSREWYQDQTSRQLKHFGSGAASQFFANWANTQGYAEHGSNIIASWITDMGEELLERIDKVWENLPEDA